MKKVLVMTCVIFACMTLSGCESLGTMLLSGRVALDAGTKTAQDANDLALRAWKKAGCGVSVGAVMRDKRMFETMQMLCMPQD